MYPELFRIPGIDVPITSFGPMLALAFLAGLSITVRGMKEKGYESDAVIAVWMYVVIGGVLGEDFNYASGDGNYYTGDTHWHPDGNWGQLFACKVAFYLDPLTAGSGCLRVIPGSQRPDHFVRTQGINPNQAQELFGVEPHDFPGSIALETRPGDLVIFNHDLFHASFGGNERRRMFTMNNTRHCTRAEDLETLHNYLSLHSPGCHDHDTSAGMFYPTMVDSAGPQRRVHLQQCSQVHDELFPQFARSG